MKPTDAEVVDPVEFERSREELGSAFHRLIGYFRDDGSKALDTIEQAMRVSDSVAIVLPAHTLKGEALQFGALRLAALAETIETGARKCVDHRETPEELLVHVVALRPLFEQTLAWFDEQTNPLVSRQKA